jgi:hypothetical protein
MKKKKLLEVCKTVMDALDGLENIHNQSEKLIGICDEVSGFSTKMESIAPKLAENFTDYYMEFMNALSVAFAFGYTLGQHFDSPYPEVQKAIESIRAVIKEKALLPYLPRERKGGKQ